MTDTQAITAILTELQRARALHPLWPSDPIHQAAIVAEEAGELVQAALDTVYYGKHSGETEKEAIHTAATAVRLLVGN